MITGRCPSSAWRPASAVGDPIRKLPADTVTICGQTAQSRNVLPGAARSSSRMVPVAVTWARVAFDGLLSVTVNCSSASDRRSPITTTVMRCEVSPARNVSLPLAEW